MTVQPKAPISRALEIVGNGLLFGPRVFFRTTAKVSEVVKDLCAIIAPVGGLIAADSLICGNQWLSRTILSKIIYGSKILDLGYGSGEETLVANQCVWGLSLGLGGVLGEIVASRFAQLCHHIADDLVMQPRTVEPIVERN